MENTTPEVTAPETPASTVESQTPEVTPSSGKQSTEPTQSQEPLDYTKDDRAKRMWFNKKGEFDPNLMYKSVKSGDEVIEKQFKPLKSQAESISKVFQDYGFKADVTEIRQALEELKTWKDPDNLTVKRGNFFSYFYDKPEYRSKIEPFFEDIRRQELQKTYPGMNDAQIQKQIELENKVNAMEERDRVQHQQVAQAEQLGIIKQQWERIQKECKEVGFPLADDTYSKLISICMKDGIDPKLMFYKFQDVFKDELSKYRHTRVQSDTIKKIEKTRRSGVIPASSSPGRSTNPTKPGTKPNVVSRVFDRLRNKGAVA